MKKKISVIIFVLLALALPLAFVACNGSTSTVDQSWAKNETIEYVVTDSSKENATVGEAKFVTTTDLSAEDKEKEPGANTKMTATVRVGNKTKISVYYADIYNVISLTTEYTDATDAKNDYKLEAKHDGKNYVYTLTYPSDGTKNKSGKINVGKSGYTDGEFLYNYVRCYSPSAVPTSIKIADPFTDEAVKLTCTYVTDKATVDTKSTLGSVQCNMISVTRAESPVGKGISVYYLPKDAEGRFSYGEGSIIKSVRHPVMIVENNLVFTLKDFEPKK